MATGVEGDTVQQLRHGRHLCSIRHTRGANASWRLGKLRPIRDYARPDPTISGRAAVHIHAIKGDRRSSPSIC